MGVSYFIKRGGKTSSVYCAINYVGIKRFILRIPNTKVKVSEWGKGEVRKGRGIQTASSIQRSLDDIRRNFDDFNREFLRMYRRRPQKDDFLCFIQTDKTTEEYFQPTKLIKIIPIINDIIKRRESGSELNNGKIFSKNTIENYNSLLKKFIDYGKFKKLENISNFDVINEDFIRDFENYLTIKRKLKLNTVGDSMKVLKSFLEILKDKRIIPFNSFKEFKIPIAREENVSIALDEEELKELFNLDLSSNKHLEIMRDQFLVLCWTGLRISDFRAFNEISKDDNIITINNKKTGVNAQIPIFPEAREILKKYEGKFPKLISEQKMNDYLKEIGKKITGLQRSIEVTYTRGGRRIKEIKRRYELLSLHVSRRTLATRLATMGLPYHEIMLITGHKTMKNFEIYIKVNKKNVLNSMISKVEELQKLKDENK